MIAVHLDDLFFFQGDLRAPLVVDAHFPAADLHPVRAVFRRHDDAVRRLAAQRQDNKLGTRRNPGRKAELLKNFRRFQFFAVQGVALRKLYAGFAVQPAEHGPERKAHGGKRAGNGILDHLRGGHVSSPKSHEPEKAFLPFFLRLPFLLVSGSQTPSGFKTSVVVVPSRPPLNVRRVRK